MNTKIYLYEKVFIFLILFETGERTPGSKGQSFKLIILKMFLFFSFCSRLEKIMNNMAQRLKAWALEPIYPPSATPSLAGP